MALFRMSFILVLAGILAAGLHCRAQTLLADAGTDTVICATTQSLDSFEIGGLPSASFGVPPYTYRWFIEPVVFHSQLTMHASDILSDSTIPNPLCFPVTASHWINDIDQVIYLEVTDSDSNVSLDSISIRMCEYGAVPLGNTAVYRKIGDTISYYCSSSYSCGIDSVKWQPHPNIVSSLDSIKVQVVIDDHHFSLSELKLKVYTSDGCIAFVDYCDPILVDQFPFGTSEPSSENAILFPNPVKSGGALRIEGLSLIGSAEIIDVSGQTTLVLTKGMDALTIDLAPGIYFVRVETPKGSRVHQLMVQ